MRGSEIAVLWHRGTRAVRVGQPAGAGRLLGRALWWMAAAVAGSVGTGVAMTLPSNWMVADRRIVDLVCTAALGGMLLWGARRQARWLGAGDIAAGLGAGAIRRPFVLLGLGVLVVVLPALWVAGLRPVLHPVHQAEGVAEMLRASTRLGPGVQLATWFVMAAWAPAAEELFFRGWLWTGLRRRWGPVATMVGTSVPWLALHMPDGAWRPVFLLPAALLFSVAREQCGGVWASLALHMLNNGVAVAVVTLALQR